MATEVISFFSTKGGVGKTTLALNTAVSLASFFQKKTLLIDLDLSGPQDMVKMLNMSAHKSMLNLIHSWESIKNNPDNIRKFITSTNIANLGILPAILHPRESARISSNNVKDVLDVLTKWPEYEYIIVDAGRDLTDHLIRVFDSSSLIFLVVTPDVLSVYQTEWFLDVFQSNNFTLDDASDDVFIEGEEETEKIKAIFGNCLLV